MKHHTRDWQALAAAIAAGTPHDTNGSLWGTPDKWTVTTGRMPREAADEFLAARQGDHAGTDYVIMSYNTPIAYNLGGTWIQPDTKYSVTTTKHQHTARVAIAKIKGEF